MLEEIAAGVELIPGYPLVSKLGEGGFGAVWKANGPGKIPVALKIIQLGDSDSGLREYKSLDLLRELRHPNLLPIHAYWLLDDEGRSVDHTHQADMLVIAMLLAEHSLRDVLKRFRKQGAVGIPQKQLLEFMRDAARGLDFLNSPNHRLGDELVAIQHRDIKPENLLVVGGGVMVADFGIAKVLESGASSSFTEHISLTLAYGAPELFEGRATSRTDQYSLALTYYELLTGRLPFDRGVTPATVINVHMKGTHDFSQVREAEQAILRKATSPAPENRYETCVDMVDALSDVHREKGMAATGDFTNQHFVQTQVIQWDKTHESEKTATPGTQTTGSKTEVGYQTVSQLPTGTTEIAKRSIGTIAIIAWIAVAGAVGGWWFATRHRATPVAEAPSQSPVTVSEVPESNDIGEAAPVAATEGEIEAASGTTTPAAPAVAPAPSLREQAAAALSAREYEKALAAYDKLVETGPASLEDFAARATARSGLAESGIDSAVNFVHAATDFVKADHGPEAAAAHHAAAGAYAKQADEQYKADSKDSEAVAALDKQAEQQLRQAIDLADQLALNAQAAWEAELAAREKLPRIANRIAMSAARDALPEVAKQLANDPNNVELLLRAARLEETLGSAKDAAAHFTRGFGLLAIQQVRAGKLDEAKTSLDEALRYDPNQQSALTNFAQGIVAAAEQDDSRALRAVTAAIELANGSDPVWEMLRERARIHVRNDRSAPAVLDLRAAIQQYPTEVPAPTGQAISADQKNVSLLYAQIATLTEALAVQEADSEGLETAAEAFRQAAVYDPGTLAYQLGEAHNLVRLAELDREASDHRLALSNAATAIAKVLARNSTLAEAHYLNGRLNLLQENAATAQQAFDRAVANIDAQRDADLLYPIYSNQATAYLLEPRDDDVALAAASKAVQLDKTGLIGQFCRAMALRNLKKVPEAINAFDAVLAIDPDHAASLFHKAQLIVEKPGSTAQQLAAARRDIDRGLSLATTDALKAEGYYVDSLAWLKAHIDGKLDASVGDAALLHCQTAVLNAIRLAPTNAVYRKAGTQVFGYAEQYDWDDAASVAQSAKLQAEYAKLP